MRNKLKFLYVLNADWYFRLHWLERALYMIEIGYDVHLAVPVNDQSIRIDLESKGITVHDFNLDRTSTGIMKELKSIFALRRIIKEISPNLIHSVTIKPNFYVSVLAKTCRFRFNYVSTYAGLGTLISSPSFKYSLVRWTVFKGLKFFYKSANNYILFENDDDMAYFAKNNISDTSKMVRVFGAGVDCDKFPYSLPSPKIGQLRVLFASRLLKSKGLDYVVNAVKELKRNGLNIRLSVAGIVDRYSPLAYSDREINDFAKEDCVDWLGERNDISSLIESCDVVALPTTYGEGVPRILIEACSIGRPIITTAIGGCKDICQDLKNGFIVRPNCSEDIALSLKYLAENPEQIVKMGRFGRYLVEKTYSNEKIFLSHSVIYSELLKE